MLVKLEKTSNPLIVLVVDENEKYIGQISLGVFHKYALTSEEILIEDDYE